MAVQEVPNELPADVAQRELEVRVLENGVVPRLEQRRAEFVALLEPLRAPGLVGDIERGDLLGGNDALGAVASARRGDGVVKRPGEAVHQLHLRLGAQKLFRRFICHVNPI